MSSAVETNGKPKVAGEIATLGTKRKVQIPKDCMEVLVWSLKPPTELIAELVSPGRIRLHLAADILPALLALLREIDESQPPNESELRAAVHDRYRRLSFQLKGEHSVLLEKRLVAHLGMLPSDKRLLYVEACATFIDVMSLSCRSQRQIDLADEISVTD
jgi:hypothetical protein